MNEGQEQNPHYLPRPKDMPGFGVTHSYPFVQAEEAIFPLLAYLLLIVFGLLFLKEGRLLLNKNTVYNLKFVYNFTQIFLCGYMSVEALMLKYRNNLASIFLIPQFCSPFDPVNAQVGNLLWLFYVSKILDFLDTFFIVITGKSQQFSFLHIYHHISVYIVYWINANLAYDSEIIGTIILNASVHTIMYSYYLVSMHTDTVWWKKYLTQIQLLQFVLMILNGSSIYFSGCAIPPRVSAMYVSYILSLLILFLRFYIGSYTRKDSKPKPKTA